MTDNPVAEIIARELQEHVVEVEGFPAVAHAIIAALEGAGVGFIPLNREGVYTVKNGKAEELFLTEKGIAQFAKWFAELDAAPSRATKEIAAESDTE